MKIVIEFDNSYEAKLTIDDRELTVQRRPGSSRLKGIKCPETEETLGGIIACELHGKITDMQKAWAEIQEEHPGAKTWDVLDEECIELVNDAIW